MSEFLVVISAEEEGALSPSEEQQCIADYGAWAEQLGEKHILARRLDLSPGKLLSSRKSLVTDGPFVEAKELIAGIIVIEATSLEAAAAIADTCPLRSYFQLFVKAIQ